MNQKEESTNYLTFYISHYSKNIPISSGLKIINTIFINLSALSFLMDPEQIIPPPDPTGSGSMTLFILCSSVGSLPRILICVYFLFQ